MATHQSTITDSCSSFEAHIWAGSDVCSSDANLGPRNADIFRVDLHPDLKADLGPVRKDLANPPFNISDWGGQNLRQGGNMQQNKESRRKKR